MYRGFSLIEILVSLLLATGLSLLLLKQQWQTSQLLNQILLRNSALNHLDNATEFELAHATDYLTQPPFEFECKRSSHIAQLSIIWDNLCHNKDGCELARSIKVW